MTDADCPNAACGGDVCTRSSGTNACNAANTHGASGIDDGWCAGLDGNPDDTKCKCRGMGAMCNGFYCTFTIPTGGGGGTGGTSGSAGSSGTAGTAGGTIGSGGGGGCSIIGAAPLAGSAPFALLLAAFLCRRARRR